MKVLLQVFNNKMDSQWWLQGQPEDHALPHHNENAGNLDCIMDHLILGGMSAATNPMILEVYSIQAIINTDMGPRLQDRKFSRRRPENRHHDVR